MEAIGYGELLRLHYLETASSKLSNNCHSLEFSSLPTLTTPIEQVLRCNDFRIIVPKFSRSPGDMSKLERR